MAKHSFLDKIPSSCRLASSMAGSSMSKILLLGIITFSFLNAFLWYLTTDAGSVVVSAVDENLRSFQTSVRTSPLPDLIQPTNLSAVPFQDSFSACLLIKDDNDILSEWL